MEDDIAGRFSFPFVDGKGRSAEQVRSLDWANSPIGPVDLWPDELKSTVGFILQSQFPKAFVWGPDLLTFYNDAFRPILGNKPEAMGRPFSEVWAEAWDEIGGFVAKAFAGESTFIEDFELQIDRNGYPETAYFTFCYSPLRDARGKVLGMMDTVIETTATVKARRDLEFMNEELAHRQKNSLALVQAIARQTLKDVEPKEAVGAFMERLTAMAHAVDVLCDQKWTSADFRQVAIAALGGQTAMDRFVLKGHDLKLGSRSTMSLSLLLNELSTNAIKYGALSSTLGRVNLNWHADGDELVIQWQESGGPVVVEPTRQGFGSRLIDMGLGGGNVLREFHKDGFRATIRSPMSQLQA